MLFLLLFLQLHVKAQHGDTLQANPVQKESLTTRKKLIIIGLTAQQLASIYVEYKWWWEGNYHPFVVNNDGGYNNYSLGIDKVGHFYTSYMYFNTLNELLKWGGFSKKSRIIVSAALPFLWAISIELGDGFSKYEFSPEDLTANSLGIIYALIQEQVPYMQNFKFKYSYFPSSYYQNNHYKGWALTSDYNGHIYWLSVNVNGALPKTAKPYWPKYLNLIVGYGINNFTEIDKKVPGFVYTDMQREFCIGLDFNLSAIPIKNPTLNTLRNMVDYYHFPAPGMKKTGGNDWKFLPLILN